MTLAFTIDWLSISINVLLVIFVAVCLLMTLLILMQRPKQEGLGAAFGGGVTDQVFGARTTNVLQKGTVWLGSLFFIFSLLLAILVGQQNKQKELLDDSKAPAEVTTTEQQTTLPADQPSPKSLAEELTTENPEAPATTSESSNTPAPAVEGQPSDQAPVDAPEEKSADGDR